MTPGHETCWHLQRRLSCTEFEATLARCGNRCEICRTPGPETKRKKLFIDHDHRYGQYAIRGPLCVSCNILMRDVDRCLRTDLRASAYMANAWFMWRLRNPGRLTGPDLIDPRVFGGEDRLPGPKGVDGVIGMRELIASLREND